MATMFTTVGRGCLVAAVVVSQARDVTGHTGDFEDWAIWPVVAVHQIHLPSDEILIWAYSGYSAWVWEVGSPLGFRELPNLEANILCSGHAALANGDYLVAGGPFVRSTQLFETSRGAWSSGPDMAGVRFYPTCTTLSDGRILVTAGSGELADIPEVYDPDAGTWTSLPGAQHKLPDYPFMFLTPDDRVFFAGPGTSSAWLDVDSDSWAGGPTSVGDGGSAVMYAPGKVMKCGGYEGSTRTTEVIDLTAPSPAWARVSDMAFERHDHSLTILPDGTVLAVGGHDSQEEAVMAAELFDSETGMWSTLADLSVPREYHSTSILTRDGRVVVAGGDGYSSAQTFNPPYLSDGPRPVIDALPPSVPYGREFVLQTPSAGRVARVSLVRLGAETHSFDQNQRFVELSFEAQPVTPEDTTIGVLTVTSPATPAIAPPGYYMLFLLDADGVPSIGEYLCLK